MSEKNQISATESTIVQVFVGILNKHTINPMRASLRQAPTDIYELGYARIEFICPDGPKFYAIRDEANACGIWIINKTHKQEMENGSWLIEVRIRLSD